MLLFKSIENEEDQKAMPPRQARQLCTATWAQ